MAEASTLEIVEDVRFLRPPQPFIWQDYIPHAISLAVVIFLTSLAVYFIRKRIRNGPNPKALALKALTQAQTLREARGNFWYLLRSNRILRDFFQDIFEIEAPAQTSRQFLASLKQVSILAPEDQQWLTEYLETCDQIRYAGKTLDDTLLTTFDARAVQLITQLYQKKKHAKQSIILEPEDVSPFLPGTPVPELSDDDHFNHSKSEVDLHEAPATT
ncbi:hypothetical protein P0Y35_02935 [Kiritimatiellaeota bacterium B1221]|nr:hypothetical protein [Kiritimatiellaeota bacterium B1221]